MKFATLSLLLMTSAAATAAFGQEGAGQGPPHAPVIVGPTPTSLPTGTSSTSPSGSPNKLVAAPPR
jgi:hypothetical protein